MSWHVVWTQSHCEQLVHDQLASRGFESFLPKVSVWSSRAGQRHLVRRPMFPGYLFVRPVMDKVFPFRQAADAHARMESSLHIGKIVLGM